MRNVPKTPIADVRETRRVYKHARARGRAANGAICGRLLILSFVMASIVYFHPAA